MGVIGAMSRFESPGASVVGASSNDAAVFEESSSASVVGASSSDAAVFESSSASDSRMLPLGLSLSDAAVELVKKCCSFKKVSFFLRIRLYWCDLRLDLRLSF